MAQRFHVIDDAVCIIRNRGVYRQVKVFRRGDFLYAGYGAGFVALYGNSGTSHPHISWDEIDAGCETTIGKLGKLVIAKQKLAVAS